MDPDDPLTPMRLTAHDTIARNAVALKTPPSARDDGGLPPFDRP